MALTFRRSRSVRSEEERHQLALQASAARLADARALAQEMELWPRAVDAIAAALLCPTEPECGRGLCAACRTRASECARAAMAAELAALPPVYALTTCSVERYHFPPDVAEVVEYAARPVPWLRRRGPGTNV